MRDNFWQTIGFLLLVVLAVAAFFVFQAQQRATMRAATLRQAAIASALKAQGEALHRQSMAEGETPFQIALVPAEDNRKARVEVAGLTGEQATQLAQSDFDFNRWRQILSIRVASDEPPGTIPNVLGDYRVENDKLVFEPRYPFKPGLTYQARLERSSLPFVAEGMSLVTAQEFLLPAVDSAAATVERVYPTRDVLPENQLKFYLHFSAPMSRGQAYARVHLLRQSGAEVEHPFLELGEELWNEEGTRFTLFFDPGRIKRGLKPREEMGPSLESGQGYVLVVDREWTDANGKPLAETFRKAFRVVEPDDVPPDPQSWKVTLPAAGTAGVFEVAFGEPLDHAMLERVLEIRSAGESVLGEVQVAEGETAWRFTPASAWAAGRYELVMETALEDLAGNSIGRPFEVDITRPVERPQAPETTSLPFEVPAAAE